MAQLIEVPGHGTVEFPDGMSDEDIAKAIKRNLMVPRKSEVPAFERDAMNPAGAYTGGERLVAGIGKGLTDAARGIGQLTGLVSREDVDESRRLDRSLISSGEGAVGNVVGSIAALSPMMLVPGMQGLGGAAGLGAMAGAIQPVGANDSRLANAAIGAVAAPIAQAGVGGATRLMQGAKNVLSPNPVRMAVRAAGDKTDDVVEAILKTESQVPGVNLTAGQRAVPAASPEFSALQALAAEKNPTLYSKVGAEIGTPGVGAQQQAAREASLRTVAGTPEELAAAVAARKAASDEAYKEAFSTFVKRDKELREIWKNPYFRDEVGEAWKLAKSKGLSPKKDLTEFMHYVKEGLDARLQTLTNPNAPAISASAKREIINVKDKLVSWLGDRNPAYDAARVQHAAMSQPINQMKMGQELEGALRNPLNDLERPVQFANTLKKAGSQISKSTGRPRIEALTGEQRGVVGAIESDLQRDASLAKLAQEGRPSMGERIKAFEAPPSGWFQPIVSAARSWFNRATGRMTEKGLHELSVMMATDPKGLAVAMKSLSPAQQQMVRDRMAQFARVGILGTIPFDASGGVLAQEQ